MATLRPCSLARVAREADVSLSTASLAIRESPLVKSETRLRIQKIAQHLGYRPDSRVSSLMARIRQLKSLHEREHLAFVWVSATREDAQRDPYLKLLFRGAQERATQLGCALDQFWLDDDGMTSSRLEKILHTRGITGVIFSAPIHSMQVRLDWNWSHFSAALIGNSEWHPNLHRAGHHHYRSMWLTMERLINEGRRRPAVILHEPHHQRIHGVHLAAFMVNHPLPQQAARMHRFGLPKNIETLQPWFRQIKADALILVYCISRPIMDRLREISQIERIVTLDVREGDDVPGMNIRNDTIAAGAVDLVVAQLHRNERGVPSHPTAMLFEGEWSG
jgi:LacI family transcriptional regulator